MTREIWWKTASSFKIPPCPYCSQLERFQSPLGGEAEEGQTKVDNYFLTAGKFWKPDKRKPGTVLVSDYSDHSRVDVNGRHFIKRFSAFHLQLIGFRYDYEASRYLEHWRTTFLTSTFFYGFLFPGPEYIFFSIARLTHKRSGTIVDGHVWPTHGLIITARQFAGGALTSEEMRVVSEALEFFRLETRGAPKLDRVALGQALGKLGPDATQKEVARALEVSPSTLREFQRRESAGMNWDELKRLYFDRETV